jgi:hypothetical protein
MLSIYTVVMTTVWRGRVASHPLGLAWLRYKTSYFAGWCLGLFLLAIIKATGIAVDEEDSNWY